MNDLPTLLTEVEVEALGKNPADYEIVGSYSERNLVTGKWTNLGLYRCSDVHA